MSVWLQLDDFNHLSWEGRAVCAGCGSPKRKSETFVYRPLNVLDEINGHPDLCEGCLTEAASQIGLVAVSGYQKELTALRELLIETMEDAENAREAMATVVRENVRLQDLIEDMQSGIEELVPDFYEDDDDDVD